MVPSHRIFRMPLLAALLGAATALGQPPLSPPGPISSVLPDNPEDPLPALLEEARRNHPGLRASRLEASAEESEGRAAAAWMAPEVGVEFWHAPLSAFPNPVEDQEEVAYFVEQRIPWPGKNAALARPARRRAEAAEARSRALETKVRREVQEAYLELYLLDARRRINSDNQSLVRRLVESARKQYEVGLGSQGDVLKAHTELASLSLKAAEIAEGRENALGRLNALLDRAPETAFTPPETLHPAAPRLTFDKVLALARERHPVLRAAAADVLVREAEAAAMGKELWPDIRLKGAYKDLRTEPLHGGEPEDGWSVMVGVDLPFAPWSAPRYRGGYRSAGTRAEMARLERKQEENAVAAAIRAALASLRAAEEGLELSRAALVPHAEQALQSVQAAYHGGKSGYMELMDAYSTAIEAREGEQEAVVKLLRGRADLEAATGMTIDELALALGGGL